MGSEYVKSRDWNGFIIKSNTIGILALAVFFLSFILIGIIGFIGLLLTIICFCMIVANTLVLGGVLIHFSPRVSGPWETILLLAWSGIEILLVIYPFYYFSQKNIIGISELAPPFAPLLLCAVGVCAWRCSDKDE